MKRFAVAKFRMYFSYIQFMVSDRSEPITGLDWSEAHSDQGFARRESIVAFSTLLEFGHADVNGFVGPYRHDDRYGRVIAVPFVVRSGHVQIEGPEANKPAGIISLSPGCYKVYCAQQVTKDDDLYGEECIDLFFEPLERPAEHSEIIVADADLHPPAQLVEDAEIAGQ